MNDASDHFGILPNRILPIRNYDTHTECDVEMNILTLLLLKQILRYSESFLKDKNQINRAKIRCLQTELNRETALQAFALGQMVG